MHARSFHCVPCERRPVSGPLSPHFRVATASCSARRLCALRISPFPQHPVSSRLSRLVPIPDPPISPSFLLFVDTTTRMSASSSGPLPLSSPLFPPLPLVQGAYHGRVYLHNMTCLCTSSMPSPLPVCCSPPPFASIKYPWSLLFFFFIPSPHIQSRATRSSRHPWN